VPIADQLIKLSVPGFTSIDLIVEKHALVVLHKAILSESLQRENLR
jgi:hypothetical protein